jgi:DNA-binding MarR family transcriptional regulator
LYKDGNKIEEASSPVTNSDLFVLISRIYHFLNLAKQHELSEYSISPQQILVLKTIQVLGAKATQAEIARQVERAPDVISKQISNMVKDGLVTKSQYKRKTNALKVSLTDYGLDVIKNHSESKLIDELLYFLTDEDRQRMYSDLNRTLHELMEHKVK